MECDCPEVIYRLLGLPHAPRKLGSRIKDVVTGREPLLFCQQKTVFARPSWSWGEN